MNQRVRTATLLAVLSALIAAALAVWSIGFVDGSSDGVAFVMSLVGLVLLPALLAATGAVLLNALPLATRIAAPFAIGASGIAAAALVAGVFIGDDPTDPAFISWVAAMLLPALVAAGALSGAAIWVPLRRMPPSGRIAITAVTALVTPLLLMIVLPIGMPSVVLLAAVVPVVLVVVVLAQRRRRLPA